MRAKKARKPTRRGRRKAATNLSLRVDLVERAKALAEQARWLAENEAAIDYYNDFVAEHGLFGEDHRQF